MSIELFRQILSTGVLVGFVGAFINMFFKVDFNKFKYHTYSTVLIFVSFVLFCLTLVWE